MLGALVNYRTMTQRIEMDSDRAKSAATHLFLSGISFRNAHVPTTSHVLRLYFDLQVTVSYRGDCDGKGISFVSTFYWATATIRKQNLLYRQHLQSL